MQKKYYIAISTSLDRPNQYISCSDYNCAKEILLYVWNYYKNKYPFNTDNYFSTSSLIIVVNGIYILWGVIEKNEE